MKFVAKEVPSVVWPKGANCSACGRVLKWKDSVLAGRSPSRGTIAFHKECILNIVDVEFPDSRFDKIKASIVENGMFGKKVGDIK